MRPRLRMPPCTSGAWSVIQHHQYPKRLGRPMPRANPTDRDVRARAFRALAARRAPAASELRALAFCLMAQAGVVVALGVPSIVLAAWKALMA